MKYHAKYHAASWRSVFVPHSIFVAHPFRIIAFPARIVTLRALMAKAALGKGLGALITTRPASPIVSPTPAVEAGERVQMVPLARIVPSPFQPRTVFRDEHLDELVGSIREHGIIQPLIVRARGDTLEIIAG